MAKRAPKKPVTVVAVDGVNVTAVYDRDQEDWVTVKTGDSFPEEHPVVTDHPEWFEPAQTVATGSKGD